jgi:hypothetical protein
MVGHAERSTGRYPENVGSGSTIIGKGRRFKKKYQETTTKKKVKAQPGGRMERAYIPNNRAQHFKILVCTSLTVECSIFIFKSRYIIQPTKSRRIIHIQGNELSS